MNISTESFGNFVTVVPEGDLDANSSIYLDETISNFIAAGQTNIHVDFGKVAYISSAGLGVFVSYLDELRAADGKFVLSRMSATVRDVFTILGLDKLEDGQLIIIDESEAAKEYFIGA